jgi:hypothetical protein
MPSLSIHWPFTTHSMPIEYGLRVLGCQFPSECLFGTKQNSFSSSLRPLENGLCLISITPLVFVVSIVLNFSVSSIGFNASDSSAATSQGSELVLITPFLLRSPLCSSPAVLLSLCVATPFDPAYSLCSSGSHHTQSWATRVIWVGLRERPSICYYLDP